MSHVELLREAARLMRRRAECVYPPQSKWHELVMAHSGTALDHALSWSPAVALAVAEMLETVAAGYKTYADRGECPSCDTGYCQHPLLTIHDECDEPIEQCQCIAGLLPVARAYLGVES